MPKHLIWFILTIACVIWYIAITWYVAFRGAKDIKEMLAQLRNKQQAQQNEDAAKARNVTKNQ
ncbi:MAG: hypothetical protein IT579_13525 [Verrucomicrobia subdivision 3 bacterium]|nr:hypothetical protein [Verrucomicrobiota bacterium]MCC6821747.1 hypothetical protein [Limisphaerales bacterium]